MSKIKAIGFDMDYTLVGVCVGGGGGGKGRGLHTASGVPRTALVSVVWCPRVLLSLLCPEYKSPEYETFSYDMIVQRLVDVGYPKVCGVYAHTAHTRSHCPLLSAPPQDIGTIPYSADFPVRLVSQPLPLPAHFYPSPCLMQRIAF